MDSTLATTYIVRHIYLLDRTFDRLDQCREKTSHKLNPTTKIPPIGLQATVITSVKCQLINSQQSQQPLRLYIKLMALKRQPVGT